MIVTLTAAAGGMRADQFLSSELEGFTRSAAQKLLEEGRALRAGKPVKKNERLAEGDTITVDIPDPEPVEVLPEDIPLDVVYEDDDVIAINKPVGMVVHPAPGHSSGTLVNALMHHCGDSLSGINGEIRPGIVHRIDRDTSGLIIVAKNNAAHLCLAEQLQDHSMYREYEAVVIGGLKDDSGTVDLPIARHQTDRKKMAVNHISGRRAVTHWQVLERLPGYTHVQCRLETGRTHQIRVHMAAIGHPVLGDPVYNGLRKGFPELAGQCLHARRLSFVHPRTGERIMLETPLPEYFNAALTRLHRIQ